MLFNLSVAKIGVVLFVALVILGPERLPEILRGLGKWLGEFKKFRENLESEVRGVFDELPKSSELSGSLGGGSLGGIENPFVGLSESVSSIGSSLRSVLGSSQQSASAGGQIIAAGGSKPLVSPLTNPSEDSSDAPSQFDDTKAESDLSEPQGNDALEEAKVRRNLVEESGLPFTYDPSLN